MAKLNIERLAVRVLDRTLDSMAFHVYSEELEVLEYTHLDETEFKALSPERLLKHVLIILELNNTLQDTDFLDIGSTWGVNCGGTDISPESFAQIVEYSLEVAHNG